MSELVSRQHLPFELEPQSRLSSSCLNPAPSEEFNGLIQSLLEYRREQSGYGSRNDQSEYSKAYLCCRAISIGPLELGLEGVPSRERDDILHSLQTERHDDFPEMHVCRLWLECASGRTGTEVAKQFTDLGKLPLWGPVQSLVYRALAHFGRRQLLAELLSECPSSSLLRMDAWMEASSYPADTWENCLDRIQNASQEWLPASLQEDWRRLLAIECSLADGRPSEADLAFLKDQIQRELPSTPCTYVDWETCRFLARALSGFVRVHLALNREVTSAFSAPAARYLPVWERRYLEGLTCWQRGRISEAAVLLQDAVSRNPVQTIAGVAQSTFSGVHSHSQLPLDLQFEEESLNSLVTRAALLLRCGRDDEAEGILPSLDRYPAISQDPLRWTWSSARSRQRRQFYLLHAAVAERRGDWQSAARAWRLAGVADKTLQRSRSVVFAFEELNAPTNLSLYRRVILKTQSQGGLHELRSGPLVGDALFFRAVANSFDGDQACSVMRRPC